MPAWLPAVLMFAGAQTATLLIWGANLSARVKVLEREMSGSKKVSDQVITLSGKVEGIGDDVKEIKGLIDGLRGPLRPGA